MGRVNYRRCKHCGRLGTRRKPISARGKCEPCGERRRLENVRQLRDHDGPFFHHWRHRVAASVGAILGHSSPPVEVGDVSDDPR